MKINIESPKHPGKFWVVEGNDQMIEDLRSVHGIDWEHEVKQMAKSIESKRNTDESR